MRPTTHRWGKRINPAAAATLLDEAAIHKMLSTLHMSVELLPLGLFTEDHAEMIAKLINLMAVDSAGKGNRMWQIADAVGQVLLAMQARVDEGKSWNVTATERETLVENIMKMDYEVQVAWEVWQERSALIAPSVPEESAVQTAARIMNVDLIRQRDELRINLDDHRALVFDLRKEVEKLRAKVAEMKQQEPFDADSDVFRSAFEAALKAGNWPATRQGGGYRSPSTQIAWRIAFSTVNRLKLYLAPGAIVRAAAEIGESMRNE